MGGMEDRRMVATQQQRYQYHSGHEFFDAARDAVRDNRSALKQLREIEEGATASGSGYGVHVRTSPEPDRIAMLVAAKAERKERLSIRIERNERIMDAAGVVIYGTGWDGFAGIAALLGDTVADVMHWYYLDARKWCEVGKLVGYSPSRCRQMRDAALDLVDAYGLDKVLDGLGIACD